MGDNAIGLIASGVSLVGLRVGKEASATNGRERGTKNPLERSCPNWDILRATPPDEPLLRLETRARLLFAARSAHHNLHGATPMAVHNEGRKMKTRTHGQIYPSSLFTILELLLFFIFGTIRPTLRYGTTRQGGDWKVGRPRGQRSYDLFV